MRGSLVVCHGIWARPLRFSDLPTARKKCPGSAIEPVERSRAETGANTVASKVAVLAARLLVAARPGGSIDRPAGDIAADRARAGLCDPGCRRPVARTDRWKVGPRRGADDPTCAPISVELIIASPATFDPRAVSPAEAEVEISVALGCKADLRGLGTVSVSLE